MKKLVVLAMVLGGTVSAHAYDYPYLTLQTADGTLTSVAVDNLQLSFADGQLVATNSDGSVTFSLTDLSKMYFSETASGSGITSISSSRETGSTVEVYTTGGVFMGRFDSQQQAQQKLRPGVYVMKSSSKTFKAVVK